MLDTQQTTEELLLNIVVLGSPSSGKHSLIQYFVDGSAKKKKKTSVPAATFFQKKLFINDKILKYKICSVPCDENFRFFLPLLFRCANAAVVMYNLSDESRKSFTTAKEYCVELRKLDGPEIIILAGNKTNSAEIIPQSEINEFAKLNDLIPFETNTTKGINVKELFEEIALSYKKILDRDQNLWLTAETLDSLHTNPETNPHRFGSQKFELVAKPLVVGVTKPKWIKDEYVKNCFRCAVPFSVFSRKHHCRACGNIFCAACCSHKAVLRELGYTTPVRICTICQQQLTNIAKSD